MQIEGIEGLLQIYTCRLCKEEGQHSHLAFSALVESGKSDVYLTKMNKPVKLLLTDTSGRPTMLIFCGVIDSVKVKQSYSAVTIFVTASSYSLLLDRQKKFRIFQNDDKAIGDILSAERLQLGSLPKILGSVTLDICSRIKNKKYPGIVIQDGETDFSFLQRWSRTLKIPFWVDDRKGTLTLRIDDKTSNHELKISKEDIYTWQSNQDIQGYSLSVKLLRYVELGHVVRFPDMPQVSGKRFLVMACLADYEDGRDVYQLRLREFTSNAKESSEKSDFKQESLVRLSGVVTSVDDPEKRGRIQIHFKGNQPEYMDMDEKKPCWIVYRSPYTGQKDGIVFLPDVGDQVEVTILRGNAWAANASRLNPLDDEAEKVQDKYIGNNFGRRIIWKEKSLEILSGENKIVMDNEKIDLLVGNTCLRLDKEGLHLKAGNEETVLNVTKDFELKSGALNLDVKSIDSKSSGEVRATGGSTSISGSPVNIESKGNLNLKGSQVKLG